MLTGTRIESGLERRNVEHEGSGIHERKYIKEVSGFHQHVIKISWKYFYE